jgi:hypothetical protein
MIYNIIRHKLLFTTILINFNKPYMYTLNPSKLKHHNLFKYVLLDIYEYKNKLAMKLKIIGYGFGQTLFKH